MQRNTLAVSSYLKYTMTQKIKEFKELVMRAHKVFIVFTVLLMLVSCEVKHPELPETPILSKSPGWVLITAKWVRLKESPSELARDISFLRYKDMAELQKRLYVTETQCIWCEIRYDAGETSYTGWVKAQDVLVLETREQALAVLKAMQ